MSFEPGPFGPLSPMPLGPRVTVPHEFEGLGVPLVSALAAVDGGLAGAGATLAPFAARTLDGVFNTLIGPIAAGLNELTPGSEAGEIHALTAAADGAIAFLDATARELPGAAEAAPGETMPETPDPGPFPERD